MIIPAQLWANQPNVNNPAAAILPPQSLRARLIGIGPEDTHLSTDKHSHQKHNANDTEQGQLAAALVDGGTIDQAMKYALYQSKDSQHTWAIRPKQRSAGSVHCFDGQGIDELNEYSRLIDRQSLQPNHLEELQ